jgi:succinyl-diaminopimelate desuccinylase
MCGPHESFGVGSVVDLARMLIAVRSQGGIDPPDGVISVLSRWLAEHDLTPRTLSGEDGAPVGVSVDIGPGGGAHYCLNACLDTAPFGDRAAWTDPPTAGVVRDGWLSGRGAADCNTPPPAPGPTAS